MSSGHAEAIGNLRVDPALLRGVPLEVSLRRFGAHWHSGGQGLDAAAAGRNFELSQRTELLNDFVSHHWGADGFPKFLSLCLLFNGPAAAVGCAVASTVVTVVQLLAVGASQRPLKTEGQVAGHAYVVSSGFLSTVVGTATYIILFFGWQRCRSMMWCRSRMVFMDRLCIHQGDEDLKAAGVFALPAILARSRNFIVLWSQRYFNRLWCVYEVALWMHFDLISKDTQNLSLVPVTLSVGLIVASLGLLALSAILAFAVPLGGFVCQLLAALTGFVLLAASSHLIRGFCRDLRQLPEQVAGFKLHKSSCSCCQLGHVLPTGKRVPCDALSIRSSLSTWFGGADTQTTGHLDFKPFEVRFRTDFGRRVLLAAQQPRPRYLQALLLVGPACSTLGDRLAPLVVLERGAALRLCLQLLWTLFGLFPASLRVVTLSAKVCDHFFGYPSNQFWDVAISLLHSSLSLVTIVALWLPPELALREGDVGPQLAITVVFAMLVVCMFIDITWWVQALYAFLRGCLRTTS